MSKEWSFAFGATHGAWHLDLVGYRVEAIDGHIGEVDSATFDDGSSCLIVDTGFWLSGKRRMVPAGYLGRIDDLARTLHLSCLKATVRTAPDYEVSQHNDPGLRQAVSDAFALARFAGMSGDPIGRPPDFGQTD